MSARRIAFGLVATVFVIAVVVLGAAWYYSGEIHRGVLQAKAPAASYDVDVLATGRGTVTLEREASVREIVTDGVWGLDSRDGYGQLREIEQVRADRVVWRYRHMSGSRPAPGDRVNVDPTAFPSDPETAFGLDYREIEYESDLGPTPAWLVPGPRATWVIFVHGLNASRTSALRLVGPVARAGFPALVLSYRNDPDAPRSDSGLREWGRTEWRDVAGAVRYAREHGASQVALVGYSMGGAVVTSFLYESGLAGEVVGAVLDSPALELDEIVELEARERRLPVLQTPIPSPLTEVAKTFVEWRYDFDVDGVDYVEPAEQLAVPTLVLHGTGDATVPIETSSRLARARPDLVTLVRFPGAGHVRAWNIDPRRYERRVLSFLQRRARVAAGEAG